jgi:hypothetical protein
MAGNPPMRAWQDVGATLSKIQRAIRRTISSSSAPPPPVHEDSVDAGVIANGTLHGW